MRLFLFERVQYVSSTKNLVNLYDGGRKTKNGQATSETQPDNHGRDVLHSATPRVWRLLPLSLGDYRVLSFILPKTIRKPTSSKSAAVGEQKLK